MRIVTTEIKVFTFNELSKEAKQKAIEEYTLDFSMYSTDWDICELDNWKRELEHMGYCDANIQYSGFWSQGDGARFTTKCIYLEDLFPFLTCSDMLEGLKVERVRSLIEHGLIDATIESTGSNYLHYNTIECTVEDPSFLLSSDEHYSIEQAIENHAKTICREIYKSLEQAYEAETAESTVRQELQAGDYEFTSDGKRFFE